MMELQLLILDDDPGIREDLAGFFTEWGATVFEAGRPSEAFPILEQHDLDVVILDLKLPEMDGLEVLQRIKAAWPDLEVIMITGHGDTRSIVEAMRVGAFDFFTKPFRILDLQAAIERTQKFVALQHRLKTIESNYALVMKELQERLHQPLIGESQAHQTVLNLMAKVAQTDATSVLISGESGTGKELVARGIHALSQRKAAYFCEVNCSAIPEHLFESELFGHRKGAFTGASTDRIGYLEAADQGTLFLDEIGDMPLAYQAKLLRVIEDRTIQRLGSHRKIAVDVRIISATNHNLDALVQQRQFRVDLLHRLNTFVIHVPPLRERPEDIPLLLDYYTRLFAQHLRKPIRGLAPEVIETAKNYRFPGNIRELKNLVERAVILCDGEHLTARHLVFPAEPTAPAALPESPAEADTLNLDQLIKTAILTALRQTGHNKSEAARLLGISRQALDRRLEKYDLDYLEHGDRARRSNR
ncbi:response regulator [candidate division KSB3 bacterium]|uniref:Response regulator n=1 Tax=candidate division KSB3 bacterium TaxID=2044937 RepID=A0A9D5JTQ6_9BACT|nr:response regulator [candidate division KSB3 bacterium]MBD3323929.1 response regulator [candidate division KSB3 bacterium]